MTTKHTEGNWHVDVDHQTHVNGSVTICIGSASTGDGWDHIATAEKRPTPQEAIANAHLIAATPELLAALERIQDECRTLPDAHWDLFNAIHMSERITAKARGQS